MTNALLITALVALFWFCRAAHYRMQFGRWVWWRLRPDELARILPRDPQSAYMRGYREGQEAEREVE